MLSKGLVHVRGLESAGPLRDSRFSLPSLGGALLAPSDVEEFDFIGLFSTAIEGTTEFEFTMRQISSNCERYIALLNQ